MQKLVKHVPRRQSWYYPCCDRYVGFEAAAVRRNVEALAADLKRLKPATSKGVYIQKITLSSTMGPGLIVDVANVSEYVSTYYRI